ncbi:tetratricopeptide (TPR) repeat protein [Altererythrobacter atlanticus]|uniref:Sulfotransferase domain protein n=1 Tax=Croceibacterium atlanticum TaxID=1267766 RepID=A0A0F7KTI9_9SPHN|nr:sulfotransferase [Croceibacterium atlanticum]AKH42456.1 Sulfotransferase domain protein [Croceibacterium atlanticum]MBB5731233.1 tetratricopeptide (TPR) repeat protein [Croceibacterium atlanticum]
MTAKSPKELILQTIEALTKGRREEALSRLQRLLQEGPASGDFYRSVARLASNIGEIDIALSAAGRFAATEPQTLERKLFYWGQLVEYGRGAIAQTDVAALPETVRSNAAVQHFLGTVASQEGDFGKAEEHLREAIAQGIAPQSWFALAMIKRFSPGDPDLSEMQRLRSEMGRMPEESRAAFFYALGKAYDDCGDFDQAYENYREGAALRKSARPYDPAEVEGLTGTLIDEYSAAGLSLLAPSGVRHSRAIFVNGLPRSGTTLVEQILTTHSAVADGGEINLFRAAVTSTAGIGLAPALAYQNRIGDHADPWGQVARTYERMLEMRFGPDGRIVDKTLLHSRLMGLLLHSLPDARVVWLRRRPADTALSCFRTYFSSEIPWSWSFGDIGHYFRQEDRLYRHWIEQFPDRILTVPYEELVSETENWVGRIAAFVGLEEEPQMHSPHLHKRSVRTASVGQVREPISTSRIGAAEAYQAYMSPFYEAYSN